MTRPTETCILCGATLFEGIIHACLNVDVVDRVSKEFARALNEKLKEKFPFNMNSIVIAEEGDAWKAIEILQTTTRKEEDIDKSSWGEGVWQNEPDYVSWITECGYQAYILRQSGMGHLCGYVFLEKGHLCHDLGYQAVNVEVHGGLTYSGRSEEWNYTNITPSPAGMWILGFDCGHSWDYKPGVGPAYGGNPGDYKQVWYVRTEVERLANQLKEME